MSMSEDTRGDSSLNKVADSLLQRVEPIGEASDNDAQQRGFAQNRAKQREEVSDVREDEEPRNNVEEEDGDDDDAVYEGDSEDVSEALDSEVSENESEESDEDSPADEDGDEDFDTPAELEISDDTLITVTVDGEEVDIPLGELKKRYAGEGAIEKRLQEATESRKKVLEQLHTNREQLEHVISAVGNLVFSPTVEPPDPALAQSNPTQYLIQKDLYEQDQQSINERRNAIAQVFTEIENRRQQTIQQIKATEAERLKKALPIISDPQKGKAFVDQLHSTAMEIYGFTPEEISKVLDHRIFVMAADAMRYRRKVAQNGAAEVKAKPTKARTIKKRGNNTPPQSQVARAQRQQRKAMEAARKTGSVDDVASTLVVPRRG